MHRTVIAALALVAAVATVATTATAGGGARPRVACAHGARVVRAAETVSKGFGGRAHRWQARLLEGWASMQVDARPARYHRYGFHCHSDRLVRSRPTPPPVFSRKIDVGGFRLEISCRGAGSPTVVLESGAGGGGRRLVSPASPNSRRRRASAPRPCRARGTATIAASRTEPVPAAKVVEELHTLLTGADISPPYVLGGWSLGGFFNRLYAKRYPAEVAGLVAVDGTPIGLPGEGTWLNPPGRPPTISSGGRVFPTPTTWLPPERSSRPRRIWERVRSSF